MLQQIWEIDGEIARVSAKGFFGGTFAEAPGLQGFEKAFTEVDGEAFEFAAYRSLVHTQKLSDLMKGAVVQKVGGEQKAVFRRECLERVLDRGLEFVRCDR